MQYKGIDLTEAIMCNVEQEAAEAFVDMRKSIKKPLTQRAFNQSMRKAASLQQDGVCTATEAVDITAEKCWQGITPEYIRNELSRRAQAAMQAHINMQTQLKQVPQSHTLTDHSWATGVTPQEPPQKLLN